MRKFVFTAVALMLVASTVGCESIHAGLNAAKDTMMSPPETAVTGAKLALDFILSILGTLLQGVFGGLFGA